MNKMQLPEYVKKILYLFNENGFEAYVVGGAVRDFLLGSKPKDYDVTTNATPEDVCALAAANELKVVENLGHNFGVVLLVVDGKPVEIGTFRGEEYGKDAHRPEKVFFCQTLSEDLSRRDFTINAMAVDKKGNLFDPYLGRVDLENGVLRTVGDPYKRFSEDALRMFRACRFCAQLGFLPDNELIAALLSEVERAQGLSLERVKSELEKILLAKHVDIGIQLLVKSGLAGQQVTKRENGENKAVAILPELKNLMTVKESREADNYTAWQHTLTALVVSRQELLIRWSVLLHDMAKEYDSIKKENVFSPHIFVQKDSFAAELAKKILVRFNYNEKVIEKIAWVLASHTKFIAFMRSDEVAINQWLKEEARRKIFHNSQELYQAFSILCEVCLADISAGRSEEENILTFRKLGQKIVALAASMPVHTNDLAISGKEVMQSLPENEVGAFLQKALTKVQDNKLKNTKQSLTNFLLGYKK